MINIDPSQPQLQSTINIDTGVGSSPTSSETADQRAAKIQFGLAGVLDNSKHQDLYQSILGGQEHSIRAQAASNWDGINQTNNMMSIRTAALSGDAKATEQAIKAKPAPVNPDSVMEQGFGRSWIASLYDAGKNLGNTDFHSAAKEEPDYIAPLGQVGSEAIAKSEMINTSMENLKDANQGQSWMGWAWDEAKGLVPGYSEYKLRGNVPGTGFLTGGLLGGNLQAQARQLAAEPLNKFEEDYPRIIKYLQDSDPSLAAQFASAVHGMSTNSEALNDIFSAVQFAPIPGSAALHGAVSGLFRQSAENAVKDVVSEAFKTVHPTTGVIPSERALVMTDNIPTQFPLDTAGRIPVKAKAQEAAGDLKSAATERVSTELEEDLKGNANPTVRAVEALPSVLRADQSAIGADTGSMSRELVNRIQEQYGSSMDRLIDTVTNTMRTMRVNLQTASRATVETIQDDMKRRYPGWSNRIFNMTDPQYEPVSNTFYMGMDIGDSDGQLFNKEAQAKRHANLLDLKDVEIRNKGAGYYIRTYKHIDESTDVMRDFLISSPKDQSPGGWVNALIGWARSPNDTMSKTENTARLGATYPIANFREMVSQESKYISDLSQGHIKIDRSGNAINPLSMKVRAWYSAVPQRKAWGEWKRVLAASSKLPGPDKVPGVTFDTVGAYERFFIQTIGRSPSYPETQAYFAKSRLDVYDHTLRNMAVFTNKASHGAESIRIFGTSEGGLNKSAAFDAVPMKELPKGNFGYYYMPGDTSEGKVHNNWGEFSAYHNKDKEVDEAVQSGKLKVYRIWAPEHRPLQGYSGVADQRIRYVVTRYADSAPLGWDQVPRRGGGHFDLDYNHYIKQAKMRSSGGDMWYEGDNTVMPIQIRKMGQDIANHLNQVRIHLLRGAEDLAQKYVEDYLPMKWQEIKPWFRTEENPDGKLSLDEPFQVVPKDRLIIDHDGGLAQRYSRFRNGLREGSDNQQFAVNYTGERDNAGLFTYNDIGTRNNPLYQVDDVKTVDPIVTMNRALNNIIHTTFMNDYKKYAVNHWLKELEGDVNRGMPNYLNAKEAPLIKSAPFAYFNSPEDVFAKGIPVDVKNNAMSNWHKINQFIGRPSTFDTYLHALEQKLVDVTYDKLGPKATVVPTWLANHITDPVQYMRKMAYHAYLGLFNPAQWLVQNQTWTNIYAISPKAAMPGTMATMLHRWARFNNKPAILEALDRKAQSMGWKPGEFTEAREALARTGFERVEGEHAYLDTPMDYSFIKNDMNNFLDLGQTFFKDGVRNVRIGAWYTAFKEFRNANPTGKLTETNVQDILNTADRYHANMSRASVSQLQRGVFSLPLQFLTYQMRLAELFLGNRLGETPAERWAARGRLIATYSALYGVPMSVGLTGLPLGDTFRKSAINNGYVVGDNWMSTAFNEGIPATALGMYSGHYYDINQRFGAHGFEFLKDIASFAAGDPTTSEALGAGYNLAIPTMHAFGHALYGLVGDQNYQSTISDWVDIAKQITSVRQGWKFYMAATTGQWLSTHEGLESSDVSKWNAAFMTLTGTQPQKQSDQFLISGMTKDREQYYTYVQQNFQKEVERAVRAGKDSNDTLADTFFHRAQVWVKLLPEDMRGSAIRRAYETNRTVADQIDWSFYIKHVPPGWQQEYLNAYARKQQLKQQGTD